MKFGLHVPLMGDLADPARAVELAVLAERSGWDGFFVWDHISPPWHPVAGDATVTLAAIASETKTMRIGPMVTPLARRRPWKVARETAALDLLSGGRLTLGVGIGGFKREFGDLGEADKPRKRAEILDESLELLVRFWQGEAFEWSGPNFSLKAEAFLPVPVQRSRPPIWTAGRWDVAPALRRAAKWEGIFPTLGEVSHEIALERLAEIAKVVREERGTLDEFDIARGGATENADDASNPNLLRRYEELGVTWWMENVDPGRWGEWEPWPAEKIRKRVEQGPPKV